MPFAVGKGVLTTCNYEARKFGCRSAMAGFVAKKLCPQLIQLPLNFPKYTAKATEVRAILSKYDLRFESASIDEAYLNITQYCKDHDVRAEDAVSQLRREVEEKTKITISAGIAANAKIAKIASNQNKPNGQCFVPSDRLTILSFMRDLPTRKVNGVGRVFERELRAIGIEVCGDIYAHRAYLKRLFGEKAFQFLIQSYLGLGRTDVRPSEEYERKSVGTESTFGDKKSPELYEQLRHTAEELEKDLTRTEFKGRTLVLKIKLHTYEVFTRQVAPPKAVNTAEDLYKYALPLLKKLDQEIPHMRLRLMGLRCTNLVSTKKTGMDFFGFPRLASEPKHVNKAREQDISRPQDEDTGEWEAWPEAEFEEAARQEKQDAMNDLEALSQEILQDEQTTLQALTSSKVMQTGLSVDQSCWDCPVCGRPLPAQDATFNAHIDLCLSRQTIREAVQHDNPLQQDEPSRCAVQPINNKAFPKAVKGNNPKRKTNLPPNRVKNPKKIKAFFG